uniref:Uncharacterized protein n=1 Tax=Paramormyrops kingsleyae TaxID=1676925 RepID=A0A3B3RVG6_9TELE
MESEWISWSWIRPSSSCGRDTEQRDGYDMDTRTPAHTRRHTHSGRAALPGSPALRSSAAVQPPGSSWPRCPAHPGRSRSSGTRRHTHTHTQETHRNTAKRKDSTPVHWDPHA